MKFTWLSNAPWVTTGYGNQTNLFIPRLQKLGHDPAVIAFWGLEGGLVNNGYPVLPKGAHPYGEDVAAMYTRAHDAWVLFSLIDAWCYRPEIMQQFGVRWCPWFPVDMEPLPPPVKNAVKSAYRRLVFSKFGERMVNEAGLDCVYIPHGVNTDVFKPIDDPNAIERLQFPKDKFIASIVAANKGYPCRKSFFEQIQAFANFHKRHPDTFLYIHSQMGNNGAGDTVNLTEYCDAMGLKPKEDVMFADPNQLRLTYPEVAMVDIYNVSDVLLNVSMGEGFGIPILEAQACGTPVIVGDWTSMSELCFAGWKVGKKEAVRQWTLLGAWQYQPSVGAIEDRLEAAYRVKGNQDYRQRAREGALAYDADKVTEKYWKPALIEIEERVNAWQPQPSA